jgi:hypothetical protein
MYPTLAELLLSKSYEVHGLVRRVALEDPEHRLSRILGIQRQLVLHAASLERYASIHWVVEEARPHECYHLAMQSFVSWLFRVFIGSRGQLQAAAVEVDGGDEFLLVAKAGGPCASPIGSSNSTLR